MPDRYLKFEKAVPSSNKTASQIASLFIDFWTMPYGKPTHMLMDYRTWFVNNLFEMLCALLRTKHLTTTAYQLQACWLVERFNKMITATLIHYVAEHQRELDFYVQRLTYLYTAWVHCSPSLTPFSLMFSQHPPGPATLHARAALSTDITATTSWHAPRAKLVRRKATVQQDAETRMKRGKGVIKVNNTRRFPALQLLYGGNYVTSIDRQLHPRHRALGDWFVQ